MTNQTEETTEEIAATDFAAHPLFSELAAKTTPEDWKYNQQIAQIAIAMLGHGKAKIIEGMKLEPSPRFLDSLCEAVEFYQAITDALLCVAARCEIAVAAVEMEKAGKAAPTTH